MSEFLSNPREIRTAYQPNFEDWYQVLVISGHVKPRQRYQFLVHSFLYALACVLLYLQHADVWPFVFGYFSLAYLWSMFAWSSRMKKLLRTMWDNSPSQSLETQVVLNDESMTFESVAGVTTAKWTVFSGATETEDYFICITSMSSYYVPKTALNKSQQDELRELIHSHVTTRIENRARGFEIIQQASVQEQMDVPGNDDHR